MMASQIQYRSAYEVYESLRPNHAVILPDFSVEVPDNVLKRSTSLYDHQGKEIPHEKTETFGFKPFSSGMSDSKHFSLSDSGMPLEAKALGNKKPLEGWDIATGVVVNDRVVRVYSLINGR